MQQISSSVWPTFLDIYGKALDEYTIRKWTFYKGLSPDIRAESWKFLLGYYPFSSTKTERESLDREKREEYERLSQQLQHVVDDHGMGSCREFSQYMRIIEKDSVRTDRHLEHFDGEEGVENIETLKRILGTIVLHDPQLGYVQGMNELLSPLMVVLQSEHQSFWCLVNVLQRMRSNFLDLSLSQPLCDLARLCLYADTQLHRHIDQLYEGDDWLFCYRGLLLNFKREFFYDDVLSLWESIWCNHFTSHYELFVGVAILVQYKSQLMQCSTVESLMEFSMVICGCVPLEPVQEIARSLVEQLKADEYCPYELRHLISSEGCAPPPLVGFVRTRQRLSTLHSNKIKHQRDELWHMVFGEAPVKAITSPFMLSTEGMTDEVTQHTPHCAPHSGDQATRTSSLNEPPKSGFVPRTQDHGISHREAIRHAPSSPFVNTQWSQPTTMENSSHSFKQCGAIDCEACPPLFTSCVHTDRTTLSANINGHEASQGKTVHEPKPRASVDKVHLIGQSNSHLHTSHTYGLQNFNNSAGFIPRHDALYFSSYYVPSHLNKQTEAESGFDEVNTPMYSTAEMDGVSESDVQFDILRSEPQLIIS